MSNGPGELYTWSKPLIDELQNRHPTIKINICLIPCQFASGKEAEIAKSFDVNFVSTVKEFLAFLANNKTPAGLGKEEQGFVISLGGNPHFAIKLAKHLGYKSYYYSFNPFWNKKLTRSFVHDEKRLRQTKRRGAKDKQVLLVGNLVADSVKIPNNTVRHGRPHIMLFGSSRNYHSLALIPFIIGLADLLGQRYENAGFVWPVSKMLDEQTIAQGIAGLEKDTLSGQSGRRMGNEIITQHGIRIKMIDEQERYAHMQVADLAITIPGTNTLELGIAGLPAIVVLPVNRLEQIPLEGLGQWLGYIPFVGKYLKRYAVKLFLDGLKIPFSLPNRFSGEDLMLEIKAKINPESISEEAIKLLENPKELARRRAGLVKHMPKPGAARKIIDSILEDFS